MCVCVCVCVCFRLLQMPFLVATGLCYFCLAGNFALMPPATQRIFGTKNGASIYGLLYSAFAFASIGGIPATSMPLRLSNAHNASLVSMYYAYIHTGLVLSKVRFHTIPSSYRTESLQYIFCNYLLLPYYILHCQHHIQLYIFFCMEVNCFLFFFKLFDGMLT